MTDFSGLAGWLRLAAIPGLGAEGQRKLLKAFGLPEHIFNASQTALQAVVGLPATQALLETRPDDAIEQALTWAAQPGNHLLTLADAHYPQALLQAADPPLLLYAKGRLALLNQPALAVVGSRNATQQGLDNAEAFAEHLSLAGMGILSGLALGIDAAAHRGALRGPGSTIAVIGTGIDRIYPARNEALARQIAENGIILSELPLGAPPLAHHFPRRNRIIAGMGAGCLVVEAAERSGSLITARLAAEAGREVFAIPGSIHSPLAKGCHKLIKQGAKLVDAAQDILEELRWENALGLALQTPPAPITEAPNQVDAQPDEGEEILTAMGFDPVTVDALAHRTGLTADTLLAMLLALELDNRVAQLPGGLYQRLNKGVAK